MQMTKAGWISKSRIKINFACPSAYMHRFNYQNPDGQKGHRASWNGSWAI
jgi:hypothetical protein